MKRKIILTMIVALFLAATVSAQTAKPNYAGVWEMDIVKSKLPATMQIESMILKVMQTEKELSVENSTKRAQSNAGVGGAGRRGGTQTIVYDLEGKESVEETGSGMMAGKQTRKASFTSDGKLNLNTTRSFKGDTGDVTMKTNEIWELLDEGKTLKVTRYMETPRGATNAEMHFTKKSSGVLTVRGDYDMPNNPDNPANNTDATPKRINGGVLNGKALSMPKPNYPAEARAAGASGTVNVKITIDETGNVVSAEAVSGDVSLREVCVEAAKKAKFAVTTLSGNPVQVTGVVVYNFVP